MLETPEEITHLQKLIDDSAAAAGPHMQGIITEEHRLTAEQLCERLQGMCLLTVATVTADGRPLTGPFDGYFLHGTFQFTSSPDAVRMKHLLKRPAVSATYLPGEDLSVTVHGRAELFDIHSAEGDEVRKAMLDHYVPKQGPSFEQWVQNLDGLVARIVPQKFFVFNL